MFCLTTKEEPVFKASLIPKLNIDLLARLSFVDE